MIETNSKYMIIKNNKITKIQKREAVRRMFEYSTPNWDFFLMLVLSAGITSLGLLLNNTAIIIGGMLVAPLLFPILSLSTAIVMSDYKLLRRSSLVILQSIGLIILVSFFISFLKIDREITFEITSRSVPGLAYFLVALLSGIAASYSLLRPNLPETLPAVAISVSLIPPLSVTGIALSFGDLNLAIGAFELFALNLIGIIFSALIIFSMFKLFEAKEEVAKNIKAEERVIVKEAKEKKKENIDQLEKQVKEAVEIITEEKNK